MRNYEFTDTQLINEVAKQFNINEEKASEELDKVRSKYTNIKKSRKILKKLEFCYNKIKENLYRLYYIFIVCSLCSFFSPEMINLLTK